MPQSFGLVSAPAPPWMKMTAGRRSPFKRPGGVYTSMSRFGSEADVYLRFDLTETFSMPGTL